VQDLMTIRVHFPSMDFPPTLSHLEIGVPRLAFDLSFPITGSPDTTQRGGTAASLPLRTKEAARGQ